MIGRRRARTDAVSNAVWLEVMARDKRCFILRLDSTHVCRDRWGTPHDSRLWLTLDHVKAQPRMGVRAPSDAAHMVAMCHGANTGVPSKAVREAERSYLAALYPEAWA